MKDAIEISGRAISAICIALLVISVAALVLLETAPTAGAFQFGNTPTQSEGFNVFVPLSCGITLSNALITFGTGGGIVSPGSNTATTNAITDTNLFFNAGANVAVFGSNWNSGPNNFYVTNTIWNPSSAANGIGNGLTLTLVQTDIYLPSGNTIGNNIYFGVSVPAGQVAGAYRQSIDIENFC